jgi:transmembrane sensor
MAQNSSASSARLGVRRERAHTIDVTAAAWAVRIDRGLDENEQSLLEDWLAGDARRAGALARAQAAWVGADRARVCRTAGGLRESAARKTWRFAVPWASAAAVLIGLTLGYQAWQGYARTHLATAIGEIRQVPLADGSRVTLDTLSRVSVSYEPATRLVRLESGEALFNVAKDPGRPFVVQAGDTRVRAVGTAFIVRRHADGTVEVTVTQGTVDVWRETSVPGAAVRLAAGNRTVATPQAIAQPQPLSHAELAGAVAWETGIIDLNGRTLGDAAAEFNRYNHEAVVISDPQLAAQKVVGRFEAGNPAAFVAAAAAMLGGHVRTDGERLILEPGAGLQK